MKKTYYSIHQNKTKRKNITNRLKHNQALEMLNWLPKFIQALKNASESFQKIIVASQPLPDYKKGANATQFFCDEANEVVIDKNGKEKQLKKTPRIINKNDCVISENIEVDKELAEKIKTIQEKSKKIPSLEVVSSYQMANDFTSFSKAIKDTSPKMLVGSAAYDGNGYSQNYDEYRKTLPSTNSFREYLEQRKPAN